MAPRDLYIHFTHEQLVEIIAKELEEAAADLVAKGELEIAGEDENGQKMYQPTGFSRESMN